MKKILVIVLFLISNLFAYTEYFDNQSTQNIKWQDIIDLKKINPNLTPQGVAVYGDLLITTNIDKKTNRTYMMVFDENFTLKNALLMPSDATHTSDLEVYGNVIYALDYDSNYVYLFDTKDILYDKNLNLINKVQTNLSYSGSACISKINNREYYVISRFLRSNELYFIPLAILKNSSHIINSDINFKLKVDYFIQGLYCHDDMLYVTLNRHGKDLIKIYNLHYSDNKIKLKQVSSLNSPTDMIEDIVIKDGFIITSGEDKNENIYYKGRINNVN
ncbi:hypothetical protein [Campylobacter geochelonis]|uniref:hypothetical protein n=1 Tax=Campylobacter geochelonis TaxID=1780362 RepID=UPI000770830B|nr:hypothetical protein [Campylobacter geochelonis]CZE50922.1 Uncharacterised protein [Campylobacter geochelonis]